MLGTLLVVLVLLWLLGIATAHTFGGLIHMLLIVAAGIAVIRVIRGSDPQR